MNFTKEVRDENSKMYLYPLNQSPLLIKYEFYKNL